MNHSVPIKNIMTKEIVFVFPDSPFAIIQFVNWITRKADIHAVPATDSLTMALIEAAQDLDPPENLAQRPALPPKTFVSKQKKRRILKGYDLYEALRYYLQHGMIPWSPGIIAPDIGVTEIIDELAVSYPDKIGKLAKKLISFASS